MWISARLGSEAFLLYSYVDAMAGPSAKGIKLAGEAPTVEEARLALERPSATVRLPGVATTPLSAEWIDYLQLPAAPPWLAHFRPPPTAAPPAAMPPWRTDPLLAGQFHPECPDDIEVTFVLLSHQVLEKMWVRLDKVAPPMGYVGKLLNSSRHAAPLATGATVMVHPSRSHPPALWVPDAATAQNLRDYSTVCEGCGFDLLLIPMAELVHMQFPTAPPGAVLAQMTTRCVLCRGTMHCKRLEPLPRR
jgi:hypothetical protein